MLQVLLLLFLGKLQDNFIENYTAWHFAIVYAIISALMMLTSDIRFLLAVVVIVMVGCYAWGYFALLRHLHDRLSLWLLVYFLGGLLPLVLFFG